MNAALAAAPIRSPDPERVDHCVVLRGVPWAQYAALLKARGEASRPRMTYLSGVLELMSPSIDSGNAGNGYSCALDAGESLTCWGYDGWGQASPPAESFTRFSTGSAHACGVTRAGEVLCWGNPSSGQCTSPAGTFVSVSAGGQHTCGVSDTGAVSCWGDDSAGQATPPAGTFSSVAAGEYHTCGITTSGDLECWGDNGFQQLDTP